MNAYSKKYNYIINWFPKSGCTYFRRLFLELHKNELDNTPTNLWHSLELDFPIPEDIDIDEIPKICLCRNPYNRVVSMFCNKYCGGEKSVLPEKFTLDKVTFREFVKKLCEFKESYKLNSIDIHISEQCSNYNKDSKNQHIIKLEEFDKSIIDIYNKLNLTDLIPILQEKKNKISKNATKKNDNTEYVYDKEFNIDDIYFPDYRYFYDKELFEMVYELYYEDFKIFGYNKYMLN